MFNHLKCNPRALLQQEWLGCDILHCDCVRSRRRLCCPSLNDVAIFGGTADWPIFSVKKVHYNYNSICIFMLLIFNLCHGKAMSLSAWLCCGMHIDCIDIPVNETVSNVFMFPHHSSSVCN